jgi:DNA-binding Lrp family transcriptional regulator
MVKAFVGVKIGGGDIYMDWTILTSARDKIAKINGVEEVHSVFGRFDLMIVINVGTLEEVNSLVSEKIRAVKGVQSTETFIASN